MKYVLWRVSNGWLLTYGNTIFEDNDHLKNYAVFHTLKEFSDWVEPQEVKPQQPRVHGKFVSKASNRATNNAGRTVSR